MKSQQEQLPLGHDIDWHRCSAIEWLQMHHELRLLSCQTYRQMEGKGAALTHLSYKRVGSDLHTSAVKSAF